MRNQDRGPVAGLFVRLDSLDYADMLTDAAVSLLINRGIDELSVRAIAGWLGVTSPTVTIRGGGRDRVLELVVSTFGRRWLAWAAWPDLDDPCPVRLPASEDEIHGARVWQALAELAGGAARAGNPVLEEVLDALRREERQFLWRDLYDRLDRPPTDRELDTTTALAAGLRARLAVASPDLTVEEARSLLADHVRGMAGTRPRPARDTGGVTSLDPAIAARLKRSTDGLVPAVVQQHDTGEVLMLGWMDDEALHRTLTTGRATYWSRSRQEYWIKGETSGHRQWVKEVRLDCDGDTLLVKVDQEGPACHTGDRTCFDAGLLSAS